MKNEEKKIVEGMNEEMVGKNPLKLVQTFRTHKKVIIPSFILALLIVGIGGAKVKDGSFFTSPYGENYAYKDITGNNSRYLIPWESENYFVDVPLDKMDTPDVEEDESSNGGSVTSPGNDNGKAPSSPGSTPDKVEESPLDITDELYYGHEPSDNKPDSGSTRLTVVKRGNTELEKIGNDLFNNIEITSDTWDVEKAIIVTESNSYTKKDAENIKSAVDRLINGSFSWDYKNEDNKLDYLSFRVGEYVYDNRMSSVPLIYDRMRKKVEDNKITITPTYDEDEVKVYIHPTSGGYIVDVPVTLTINENGKETTKQLNYLSQFVYRSPSPVDVWKLWATRAEGVYMIGDEYAQNDLKGGN